MNKQEKVQLVGSLKENFSQSSIILVAHYAGLTVEQMNALRMAAKDVDVKVKVAKNSLIKLALEGTDYADLQNQLTGPTLLVFAEDIVSAAKVLVKCAKDNELLEIKTGSYNNSLLGKEEIINISKMPSLDEIRAKLISLIQTPATKLACVLQAPASQCARVIKAYSEK